MIGLVERPNLPTKTLKCICRVLLTVKKMYIIGFLALAEVLLTGQPTSGEKMMNLLAIDLQIHVWVVVVDPHSCVRGIELFT